MTRSEKIHRVGASIQAVLFVLFVAMAIVDAIQRDYGWLIYNLVFMVWTALWFRWELRQLRRMHQAQLYATHLRSILDDIARGIGRPS